MANELIPIAEFAPAVAAETAKREADKAHRAQVLRTAHGDLVLAGVDDASARAAIVAIAKGSVRGVRVEY